MTRLAIIVAIAAAACNSRPDGANSGSATPPFVTTAPQVQQPIRSDVDQRHVATAARALRTAHDGARIATTLDGACAALAPLLQYLGALHKVTPPTGREREFSTARNTIDMTLDVIQSQYCIEGSGADADTIRDKLENLHGQFVKLQGIGAK